MTLTQFEVARAYYERLLKRQVEEDIPDREPPSETRDPGASEALSASAPDNDAHPDAKAREALVREAMGVGLPGAECRHVVAMHKDLAKAREILTNAARKRIQAA